VCASHAHGRHRALRNRARPPCACTEHGRCISTRAAHRHIPAHAHTARPCGPRAAFRTRVSAHATPPPRQQQRPGRRHAPLSCPRGGGPCRCAQTATAARGHVCASPSIISQRAERRQWAPPLARRLLTCESRHASRGQRQLSCQPPEPPARHCAENRVIFFPVLQHNTVTGRTKHFTHAAAAAAGASVCAPREVQRVSALHVASTHALSALLLRAATPSPCPRRVTLQFRVEPVVRNISTLVAVHQLCTYHPAHMQKQSGARGAHAGGAHLLTLAYLSGAITSFDSVRVRVTRISNRARDNTLVFLFSWWMSLRFAFSGGAHGGGGHGGGGHEKPERALMKTLIGGAVTITFEAALGARRRPRARGWCGVVVCVRGPGWVSGGRYWRGRTQFGSFLIVQCACTCGGA
jgi:hypothetical protein